MDILTLVHQAVLFAHLVAFAIAVSAVLREDLTVLRTRRIAMPRLRATARTLSCALAVLWASGAVLLAFDTGLDPGVLLERPKALAKLLVVTALTANGWALHTLAFPALTGAARGVPALPLVLGAISTVSWLYAAFIGAARLIAPAMALRDYIALYALLLAGGTAAALVFIRPRIGDHIAPLRWPRPATTPKEPPP